MLAAALLCLIVAAFPARADMACAFDSQPRVLMEDGDPHEIGGRLLQVWDVPDHPVFWSGTVPGSEAYRQFRSEAADLNIETDPVRLLERSPTENNLIVIRNAGDWIRPAGCLEMLLYGYQHARLKTFEAPSEFASIILRSPDRERLRVYYYTINHDGIGRMDPIVDPALADKGDGWEVLVALHNHAFHPGQPEIDGILAPSEPDADFHVRFHEASSAHSDDVAGGLVACLEDRRSEQLIAKAIACAQIVSNVIDGEGERTSQDCKMMFMARKSRTIVGNALVRRDLALDHFQLQPPTRRREGTTGESVLAVQPNTLVSTADERRKVRLQRRQEL